MRSYLFRVVCNQGKEAIPQGLGKELKLLSRVKPLFVSNMEEEGEREAVPLSKDCSEYLTSPTQVYACIAR